MNNRSHQHIKNDTLSEYLDGRIPGSALLRFEQDLAACQSCQDDMESLRSTITMLRELPEEAPRRSFVMTAPPPMHARTPSSAFGLPNFLRVPQWAYAGAASLAVIVFVALISADASGLLAPDGTSQEHIQVAATTQELESQAAAPQAASASVEASADDQDTTQTMAFTAAASTVAPEKGLAAAPPQESLVQESLVQESGRQEPAVQESRASETGGAAILQQAAAAPASAPEDPAEEPAEKPPESPGLTSSTVVTKQPASEPTEGASGPAGASGDAARDTTAAPEPALIAQPEVERAPATAPVPAEIPQRQNEGTAAVWRVLEIVAAIFGLIFLAAMGLKWKLSKR